ncbi:MAG TPA: TlpA disulfide reductase family protein [Polyangiaceae bacterium]|nr:TlpA disulfide reductase family protein [Polyangiaceae bacterium]
MTLRARAVVRLAAVASLLGACARPPAPPAAVARLPEVPVLSLDHRMESLPAVTRGRPALVALWATWCTTCAHELGELDRLQARVGGDALVVGVAVGEPYEHVAEYLRTRRLAYAQLVDEDFKLSDALGARRVPATWVVDRNGAVRYSGGALDARALAALRDAMAE